VSGQPQQPYLLRALYEWCVDSGYTPYVTVRVDTRCRVPMAFVREGQIVLNIGPNAVRNLQMDNEWVSFSARFGGVSHDILIPALNVLAIYARETGEGMVFPPVEPGGKETDADGEIGAETPPTQEEITGPGPDKPKGKPRLRVVK
jgi:stringent starvation protein B